MTIAGAPPVFAAARCTDRGVTGERVFGFDYYQNLMLWALPAAIDGKSLDDPCKPGGLVDWILQAGKTGHTLREAP